ncbi:hypothetical protein AT1G68845 [Arabidopsis thaliana]|uniref:Uncharacterized protein n=1 Tax=Arabidopsis thaliana TaxID=3702 RepID=F4HYZ1_ARATH|nr:uncharacterized protein AT1G68845 [Arabidopsis thaliana]AEE34849.1 hypothetical protein AT1G68845 [Arabidopsis thaliana]|eukprot:NP_683482.1 hypothetical protein AT1G68845 [Arabidopsis thaliana]
MISHRKCEKVAKQRCLTRAGLKRYDSQRVGKGLSVKSHYSQSYVDMGLLFEETLTYAQFMVEVRVDVVYASEHEWGGKKLIRSLLVSKDKISHLARLTTEDKASIVRGLADHLMKQRRTWSKQRWVPLLFMSRKKEWY